MSFFSNVKLTFLSKSLSLFFLAVFMLTACGNAEPPAPPPVGVTAMVIQPRDIPITGEYMGQTAGYREVEVRAQVGGILIKRAYTEGEMVNAGDLLFQIDPAPYEAALVQAKGTLAQTQAKLQQAKFDNDRFITLYDEAAVSKKERDDAVGVYKAALGDVISAKGVVSDAQINLGYTTVVAPITGSTSEESVSEGNLITVGQILTTLVQLDPLYVNFSIPATDALRYKDMMKRGVLVPPADNKFEIDIKLSDGSMHSGYGELDFVDPRVDPATSSIKARAQLVNSGGAGGILPGQFARVYLKGYLFKDAIAIPQRAVLSTQDGPMIYVIDAQNKAQIRPIVQEINYGTEFILREGVKAGDKIIVDGILKVRPGAEVKIIEPENKVTGGQGGDKGKPAAK